MRRFVNAVVVLVIVGFCVGLVTNGVVRVRDAANRAKCQNNLKQLVWATQDYTNSYHEQFFPPAAYPNENLPLERRLSWLFVIMPYIQCDTVYRDTDKSEGWDSPANRTSLTTGPWRVFRCPGYPESDPGYFTHYVGIAGVGADAGFLSLDDPRAGLLGYDRQAKLDDVTDGLGATILLIETCRDNGPWAAAGVPTLRDLDPEDPPYLGRMGRNAQFGSGHRTIAAEAGFADGSVRSLSETLDPRVFEAFATIAGKEKVEWGE